METRFKYVLPKDAPNVTFRINRIEEGTAKRIKFVNYDSFFSRFCNYDISDYLDLYCMSYRGGKSTLRWMGDLVYKTSYPTRYTHEKKLESKIQYENIPKGTEFYFTGYIKNNFNELEIEVDTRSIKKFKGVITQISEKTNMNIPIVVNEVNNPVECIVNFKVIHNSASNFIVELYDPNETKTILYTNKESSIATEYGLYHVSRQIRVPKNCNGTWNINFVDSWSTCQSNLDDIYIIFLF